MMSVGGSRFLRVAFRLSSSLKSLRSPHKSLGGPLRSPSGGGSPLISVRSSSTTAYHAKMMVQPRCSSFLMKLFSTSPGTSRASTKRPAAVAPGPQCRSPSESPARPAIMARFRTAQRKKCARSIASEDPWKVDTPFGPPRISHLHVPGGIRRIRNTFAKLTPAARAERELLRQKNMCKVPLTERNMDTFVTRQEFAEACYPNRHSNEVQVVAWLERLY